DLVGIEQILQHTAGHHADRSLLNKRLEHFPQRNHHLCPFLKEAPSPSGRVKVTTKYQHLGRAGVSRLAVLRGRASVDRPSVHRGGPYTVHRRPGPQSLLASVVWGSMAGRVLVLSGCHHTHISHTPRRLERGPWCP